MSLSLANRRGGAAWLLAGTLMLGAPAFGQVGGTALRSPLAEGAGPAGNRARDEAPRPRDRDDAERPPPNVAPAEAARRASREYGGRVLNVALEDGPGGPYYRVKLLDGGRVRVVHVEARH